MNSIWTLFVYGPRYAGQYDKNIIFTSADTDVLHNRKQCFDVLRIMCVAVTISSVDVLPVLTVEEWRYYRIPRGE